MRLNYHFLQTKFSSSIVLMYTHVCTCMYLLEGLWVMSAGDEVGHGVQGLLQDAVVGMAVRSVHAQVL